MSMADAPDDDEPKRSGKLPVSAFKTLARPIRRFAEAMLETGDVTTAYLESHPHCKSRQSAKYRGRALLKRGDVRAVIASLKQEAAGNQGDTGRKAALLSELETLGFAHVNLKKLHPKEKIAALRAIAELEGLLAPKPAGAGIKATFNFRIGGHLLGTQDRARTIAMSMDTVAPEIAAPAPPIVQVAQSDEPAKLEERLDALGDSPTIPDRGCTQEIE